MRETKANFSPQARQRISLRFVSSSFSFSLFPKIQGSCGGSLLSKADVSFFLRLMRQMREEELRSNNDSLANRHDGLDWNKGELLSILCLACKLLTILLYIVVLALLPCQKLTQLIVNNRMATRRRSSRIHSHSTIHLFMQHTQTCQHVGAYLLKNSHLISGIFKTIPKFHMQWWEFSLLYMMIKQGNFSAWCSCTLCAKCKWECRLLRPLTERLSENGFTASFARGFFLVVNFFRADRKNPYSDWQKNRLLEK